MADFPSTLTIKRENYKETPPKNAVRSQMGIGPDKVRKRSSAAVRLVSFEMFLTDDELETFDVFYETYEAVSFNFTSPRTGDIFSARFVSEPSYSLNETMWNVSVELELLP